MGDDLLISLTSTEDGDLISERLFSSSDVSFIESGCNLHHMMLVDCTLHINIKGTGVFMVSICNGNRDWKPLHLGTFRHTSNITIKLYLNGLNQITSTLNDEDYAFGVESNKETPVKLTLFEGQFTTSFTQNGKVLLDQTCEIAKNENMADSLLGLKTDLSWSGQDKQNGRFIDLDDSANDDKIIRGCKSNIDEMKEAATDDEYAIDNEKEATTDNRSDFDNDKDTIADNRFYMHAGKKAVLDDRSGIDDEKESFTVYRYDIDEDREVEVSGSTQENPVIFAEAKNFKKQECSSPTIGVSMLSKDEELNHELVDSKTHRTELLKIIRANNLADYFYEADLISEDEMEDIQRLCDKGELRVANRYFLKTLRYRRVKKHKIEAVLTKAGDQHLLELLFPKQLKFVSTAAQTDF